MTKSWTIRRGLLLAVVMLASCGQGPEGIVAGQEVDVTVTPSDVQVPSGGGVEFSAAVTATMETTVDWVIDQGTAGGTITTSGQYTAPTATGTYTIRAVSRADPTKSGTATATVTSGTPVAAAPRFTPGTTSSANPITVAIACPNSGTISYVTTDGSTPTTSSSASSSVTFSASGTLKAICAGSSYSSSAVATATYTIGSSVGGSWVTATGAACTNAPNTPCEFSTCKNEAFPSGPIYYYCSCGSGASAGCQQGSDGNTGTDPLHPRLTVSNAFSLYGSLPAGATIAFCRGGVFGNVSGYWFNSRSTQSSPITIRDYDPHCAGPSCVNVWGAGTEPRPVINGTWNLASPDGSGHPQNGIRLRNVTTNSIQLNAATSHVNICNVQLLNANIGAYVANSQGTCDDVVIQGSRFINSSNQGYLGSGSGNQVLDSYFFNCGYGDMFTHTIYFGGYTNSTGSTAARNEVHPPSGSAGVAISMHGIHTNMLVEGNKVIFDQGTPAAGGWGIALMPGYGGQNLQEHFDHAVVRGNLVVNAGNLSMGVDACQNCLIENNVIVNTQQGTRALLVPYQRYSASDAIPSTGNIVRNNTIYATASGSTGIGAGMEGTGYVVANNAVQVNGTCFSWNGASSAYSERDFNISYQCNDGATGSHSSKANPQWVSAGSDFRPNSTSSPLTHAGDSGQDPSVDFAGVSRPTSPSIGALEP